MSGKPWSECGAFRIPHSAFLFLFHILAVLATAARAQAPTPAAPHPGLFWPANELMVRQAVRSDLHDLGRAWHLEARTRIARRPSRRCRQCDHPVIQRNADLCGACAARWEQPGAWDLARE